MIGVLLLLFIAIISIRLCLKKVECYVIFRFVASMGIK